MILKNFSLIMQQLIFEHSPIIAVATSGGSDSMALLLLADLWSKSVGAKIIALTIDHQLRDDSSKEADLLNSILISKKIEHHVIKWHHNKKITSNIQAKAREARYQLLTQWCNQHDILHLLIAHQQEDQIENFIIRLERGSGLSGLAKMSTITYLNKVRIIRPLLNFSKKQLQTFLIDNNSSWLEDPSNNNEIFKRVIIRKLLINQQLSALNNKRLLNTIYNLARAKSSIERVINKELIRSVKINRLAQAVIDYKYYFNIMPEEALRILRQVLVTIGGKAQPPRFKSLLALYKRLFNTEQSLSLTLGGCKIIYQIQQQQISIYSEINYKINKLIYVDKPAIWLNQFLIIFDYDLFKRYNNQLTINYLKTDINNLNIKYLIKQNLISWQKEVLFALPVVKLLDKIVAIPHLDYYQDDFNQNNVTAKFKPHQALSAADFEYN